MHVNHSPRCPGVALVDPIAMRVHLQRAIKMRTFFDRATTIVLDHSAPKDRLTFVVRAL